MALIHHSHLLVLEEQLILQRYSYNTIKTYKSCFKDFLIYYEKRNIENLSSKEIKGFILHLIQTKKIARATQNQYINAIKYYYERILNRPKENYKWDR
ncbi:MAG: phage integrase N-terminal SAM-like domain-containing protein, partial [Saprospiraceae bacterium]|nr:phage integrase N-terminal SAM-like domain-containing protein [Saprospiraceae bacterium]